MIAVPPELGLVVGRLGSAVLTGAALGLNRQLRAKPAGLRTHAVVALGSALVVLTSDMLVGGTHATPTERGAVTRAIQGIIAGIGFLGAGAILKGRINDSVRGLTTAASIWLAACLGTACGAGYWLPAAVATAFALCILVVGKMLERATATMTPAQKASHDIEQRRGRRRSDTRDAMGDARRSAG